MHKKFELTPIEIKHRINYVVRRQLCSSKLLTFYRCKIIPTCNFI